MDRVSLWVVGRSERAEESVLSRERREVHLSLLSTATRLEQGGTHGSRDEHDQAECECEWIESEQAGHLDEFVVEGRRDRPLAPSPVPSTCSRLHFCTPPRTRLSAQRQSSHSPVLSAMLAFTSPAALARSLARSSDGLVSCVSGHLQLAPITPSTRRACLSRPFSSLASSSTSSPSALAAFRVRAPYHSFQSNRSPTLLAAARSFSASSPSPVIRDSYFRDDSQRSNRRNAGRPPSSGGAWEKLKAAFWAGVMRFERLPFKTVVRLVPRSPFRLLSQGDETLTISESFPDGSHHRS